MAVSRQEFNEAVKHLINVTDVNIATNTVAIQQLDIGVTRNINDFRERVSARFVAEERRSDTRFATIDQQFTTVNKRFDAVDQQFATIDKRFDAIEQRFAAFEARVEAKFSEIDKRFEKIEHQLETIEVRLTAMERLLRGIALAVGVQAV